MKLFLDDYRSPKDCVGYMQHRIGKDNPIYLEKDWIIVKSYNEFVEYITNNGIPSLVSFDHDLAHTHYGVELTSTEEWKEYYNENNNFAEKTGYDCAKWLKEYCLEKEIDFPKYFLHTMNPAGLQNIKELLQ